MAEESKDSTVSIISANASAWWVWAVSCLPVKWRKYCGILVLLFVGAWGLHMIRAWLPSVPSVSLSSLGVACPTPQSSLPLGPAIVMPKPAQVSPYAWVEMNARVTNLEARMNQLAPPKPQQFLTTGSVKKRAKPAE